MANAGQLCSFPALLASWFCWVAHNFTVSTTLKTEDAKIVRRNATPFQWYGVRRTERAGTRRRKSSTAKLMLVPTRARAPLPRGLPCVHIK